MKKFLKKLIIAAFLIGVGAAGWHFFSADVQAIASEALNDASMAVRP